MEYCSVGSVGDIMEILKRALTEPEISAICWHMLNGLKYLHENKKIHRDIKPDNVLLNTKGEPKLGKKTSKEFNYVGSTHNVFSEKLILVFRGC